MEFVVDKAFLDRLEKRISKKDLVVIQELQTVHPADLSLVLDQLDENQGLFLLQHLDRQHSADALSYLEEDRKRAYFLLFSPEEIAKYIDLFESDDAADILQTLPVKLREKALGHMDDKEKADHIVELLHYDEDCAGGLMAKELVKARVGWSVKQCIQEIRRQGKRVGKIHAVFVVDEEDHLLGRLSLKEIIIAQDDAKIQELFHGDLVSVKTYRTPDEVADIMQKYDLETVPVVNVQNKLVGRITIDDVIDRITDKAEQDQQLMAGITEDVDDDESLLKSTRARLPWLIIGMLGGILGAQFMGLFEKDLLLLPAMAFFIPLITATGGNVGIQSSTLMVQALANRELAETGIGAKLWRMLLVALVNGLVLSGLVLGISSLLSQPFALSLLVAVALFCVVLFASFIGTITPLLLHKMKINPAAASGPFITTANDLLGLGIYFGVARLLLY